MTWATADMGNTGKNMLSFIQTSYTTIHRHCYSMKILVVRSNSNRGTAADQRARALEGTWQCK